MAITVTSPAKTNLSLRVLGKREDGYHEIATRMVPLSLADTLTIEPANGGGAVLTCSDASLPVGEENLVLKAVRALENRAGRTFDAKISLEKKIPHGAGLGGGSGNAAATLQGLNEAFDLNLSTGELIEIAAAIGSDVPFFIHGTVCDCTGRGEIVTPVPAFPWDLPLFMMKPAFGVPTPWAYQSWATSREIPGVAYVPQICPWGVMENGLERPVFAKYLPLARMKMWLLDQREVHAAILSGSGSCLLAVLTRNDYGRLLEERALSTFGPTTWTWVGHSVGTLRDKIQS
ncbi:MAG: 4-(cytidine 5'-diphospho)-2-C-methyl-D-erythritol kinase [Verrucomicrobiae bacterium]|nr:4-(cytidine 5'-diphospho)-2-C-methyl-D-erythritol kinase [Verrucomicrobiae bacterium]